MPRILTEPDIMDFRTRTCAAAAEIFARDGYQGLNMRELSKRLGVSAMTPYRYFKNKNEILALVRAHGFTLLAEALEAAWHGVAGTDEKGAALVHAYLDFAARERFYYQLMFDQAAPFEIADPDRPEARIVALLAEHGRLAAANPGADIDAQKTGQLLWTLLHGFAAFRLAGRTGDDLAEEALIDAVASVAAGARLARGMAAKKEPVPEFKRSPAAVATAAAAK